MDQHTQLVTGKDVRITVTPIFQIFYKDGYGIYNCQIDDLRSVTIKGSFALPLQLQQVYDVEGKVTTRNFDKQIEVKSYTAVQPKGAYKVIAYLTQLHGLKSRAETIYEKFGDKSIDILKKEPEKIANAIKGISLKKAKEWQAELLNKEVAEKDTLYLLNLGLNSKKALQLIENYGRTVRKKLENNPYILLEVKGGTFGFLKCDELAKKIDFDFGSPIRIEHGLLHCLKEAGRSGHTFLPKPELSKALHDLLSVTMTFSQMRAALLEKSNFITLYDRTYHIDLMDLEKRMNKINSLQRPSAKEKYRYPLFSIENRHFENALDELTKRGEIVIKSDRIALDSYYTAEETIALETHRLAKARRWHTKVDITEMLDAYLSVNGYVLEEKQTEAVHLFCSKRGGIFCLNGSAGTGKTFTLKIILEMLKDVFATNKVPFKIKVMAPTGKSSKVAAKATGYEVTTIHRSLEYNPENGFVRNRNFPLDANIVVVDEFSMADAKLAASLFEAIATGTKVIIMGDTKQLPSVGAGNVLRDLMKSGIPEVVTLNVVKRQGLLSGLIKNANRIINGDMIESEPTTGDSFVMLEESDIDIRNKTMASIKRLLSFPEYTLDDVQVLVAQKRGTIGVYELNELIQKTFNPSVGGLEIRNVHADKLQLNFRKGDKVIHLKNNNDRVWFDKTPAGYVPQENPGIANGETGVIEDIIEEVTIVNEDVQKVKKVIVRYDTGYIFYVQGEELNQLDHAYCLSIHKSQGSQWPAVLVPISNQHAYFLDRNLIYTALSRPQLFGAAIGPERTIRNSIRNVKSIKRFTQLQDLLLHFKEEQVA